MCFYLPLNHLAVDDLEDAVAEHEEGAVYRALVGRRHAVNPQAEADVRGVLLAASDGALRVVDAARIALCLVLDLGVVQSQCVAHDALVLGLRGLHFERVGVVNRGFKVLMVLTC